MTMTDRTATASPRNTQGFNRRIVARIVPYGFPAGKRVYRAFGTWDIVPKSFSYLVKKGY
jgi:hypothetical protein